MDGVDPRSDVIPKRPKVAFQLAAFSDSRESLFLLSAQTSAFGRGSPLEDEMASVALQKIRENEISQLVVIDKDENYKGILHIHNLINEGLI